MRGALRRLWSVDGDMGIIPAYAGSTCSRDARPVDRQDHPRVCGEHLEDFGRLMEIWGSSPRMRGALNGRGLPVDEWRIIPAYAGSTVDCIQC